MRPRPIIVVLHRYAGLAMAAFLIVIGLTGSLIVFNGELTRWLDPPPHVTPNGRPLLSGLELHDRLSKAEPRATFNFLPLSPTPGEATSVPATPRTDLSTGAPYELGYDRVYADPYTGSILRRTHDAALWPISRTNFVPLVNRLHYSLALPGSLGIWLFGGIALVWTIDCLWSIYLTFPTPATGTTVDSIARRDWIRRWWRPSWVVKWRGSALRVNFDLHRAGGLWLWLLLFAFAWTGVGFNLGPQVYVPTMAHLFGMPDAYGTQLPLLANPREEPAMGWPSALDAARRHVADEASRTGFVVIREEALLYQPDQGAFLYLVRSDRDLATEGGAAVLLMTDDGRPLGFSLPRGQNIGRTLDTWMFALHVANFGGLPYRIFVAVMGIAIAGFSGTGVYIWLRKRNARRHANRNRPHPVDAGQGDTL